MKFFPKNESDNIFKTGQLLKISNPKSGWRKKVNKNVSNLFYELDSEFIIAYDFNETLLKNNCDDDQAIGKRVYIPSGTSCLYLACDIISTKNLDSNDEDIIFELHRILIENKTYWVFDIFLQKN